MTGHWYHTHPRTFSSAKKLPHWRYQQLMASKCFHMGILSTGLLLTLLLTAIKTQQVSCFKRGEGEEHIDFCCQC